MKKIQNKKIKQNFFKKINEFLFILFIFLLPTQLGKHFFPSFSYINGIRVDYLSPTLYLTDILVFLLMVFNFKEVVKFFENKKIIFFLGLFILNIVLAGNKLIALYRYIKILEFLIVFYLGRIFLRIIKEKLFLIVLFSSGIFQLFLSIFQIVYKHSFQGIFYFFGERLFNLSTPGIAKATLNGIEFLRPYGTFSHPNSYSGFFLLLYFYVLTNKKFNKYFLFKYINLFICSILIFISFSKIAIITFLLLNSYYWFNNKNINCFICKLSRIIVPFILSVIFLQATTDPLTVTKRIELINNSLLIIKNHIFTGVGLGNYLIVQSNIPSKIPLFFNQPVHNIFLLFISEVGIPISIILIIVFLLSIKANPYVLLVVLFAGFFDHYFLTLQQNYLLFAFLYGSVSIDFFIKRFKSRS